MVSTALLYELCLLTRLACGLAQAGQAAEIPPEARAAVPNILSLSEAKRQAFERNWDLLAARSDVDAATALRIVARELPNPTLSLGTTKISADRHPNSTAMGNGFWARSYDTVVAINQLLELGGKRASRQASARAGWRGAQARLADARRQLDLGVTKAYVAALLAARRVEILRQSAASLRQEATIAQSRLQAGDISNADKDQIQIAAERLELDARSADADARIARIALEVILGLTPAGGAWTPADTLDLLADANVGNANSAGTAVARADLVAAQAAREKADAELRLQKAMRIPDPTVFVQYEHEPPDLPNSVGAGVSFPIPLWHRNGGAIAAAKAAEVQAGIALEKTRAQIDAEIAAARLAQEEAVARRVRYVAEIQPRSAEVRQSAAFAYQRGGVSLLDLLSAERNDNDVRLAAAQATADAATAGAALAAALAPMAPSLLKP